MQSRKELQYLAVSRRVIQCAGAVQPDGLTRETGALPGLGHNGGPPLEEEDPGAAWRLWCWRRASKKAWSVPREVALRRLARAEELDMTYREYTIEILERGRYL